MKKKILIIDDEAPFVETINVRLEFEGYEVLSAGDGQEGLEKAREIKPDLILLDVMMPKMDGYQVCRMLKFDDNFKDIPIIMLTARAQDTDRKTGKEVGANDYISKPFEMDELLEKIKELLK